MRILLAEDNRQLSEWIAKLLRRDRYVIDCVLRGDEADAALSSQDYALVILDLGLPHMDGIEVLRRFRASGKTTPVIILTANDAVSSRVKGLDSGADDSLVKPFNVEEFEARVRAQLRRSRASFHPFIRFGPLAFHTKDRSFSMGREPLLLTGREHAVLEALVARAGRPITRDALSESVSGFDEDADTTALDICVHRVRRKLEGSGVGIATLRGLGYALRHRQVSRGQIVAAGVLSALRRYPVKSVLGDSTHVVLARMRLLRLRPVPRDVARELRLRPRRPRMFDPRL